MPAKRLTASAALSKLEDKSFGMSSVFGSGSSLPDPAQLATAQRTSGLLTHIPRGVSTEVT